MFGGGGGVPILSLTLAKATGAVFAGIFAVDVVSTAINVNSQKKKIKNGKLCGVCKGKGFYTCKLCNGKSTTQWSRLVHCCLNCLGSCYV